MRSIKQVQKGSRKPDPIQNVRKLRRIFGGSMVLCLLIVFHMFLYIRSAPHNMLVTQVSLLSILMWSLVVTYYAFNTLAQMEEKARAAMKELLRHDSMTGALTVDCLRSAIEQRHVLTLESEHEVTIGYVHVVGLSRVNEEFGHTTGNVVMRGLAKLMADTLPATSLLARLGGAEFVAFMPQTTLETARETMDQVREAIRAYSLDLGGRGSIEGLDAQVGTASYVKGAESLDTLIHDARNNVVEE